MKTNKLLLAAFVVVVLVQLFVPVKMIFDQQDILASGTEYKFKTAPVDPYDAFRGKYVALSFDESSFETDTLTTWETGENCFVQLFVNEDGFAEIADVTKYRPEETEYVKAGINYTFFTDGKQTLNIQFPFDKFFMEEDKAPAAERVYNLFSSDSTATVYALVVIQNGDAVLKDVMINDTSIMELAKRKTTEIN